ncbi:MAG: hypothetical protein LBU87_05135 [Lactobacillales bacterium]|jgi:hypothetical protein|nr:hypothetical protein [Lactobacillales bacterium]
MDKNEKMLAGIRKLANANLGEVRPNYEGFAPKSKDIWKGVSPHFEQIANISRPIDFTVGNLTDIAYSTKRAYDILRNNKSEMERINKHNADNYYHRKAMCEIGQGAHPIINYAAGTGFGVLKEYWDIFEKSLIGRKNKSGERERKPFGEMFMDSVKDINNNADGLILGLKNPNTSCKLLLEDFDWNENKWKKQKTFFK